MKLVGFFLLFHIHHLKGPVDCKLVFLPPYSPDLNPIKQAFSAINAFLQRNWKDQGLSIIDHACHNIMPDMAWGFFHASGYVI